MASVAGRKKSIVSNTGLQIDTPVANNTLLNKSASQSTSLYQQCSSLRSRLVRIHNFPEYFALASPQDSSRQSTDPVTQLWDCFALGIPLCYIFNLLPPPVTPISIDTDPHNFDVSDLRAKKRAIALFAMQIRQVSQCEPFTVTDLWDRNSTDGLVKVINTVTVLVDQLPEDQFIDPPLSPPSMMSSQGSTDSLATDSFPPSTPLNAREAARNNIIREMVETERKYVQDLEIMQKYSNALSQSNTMSQDTIHLLFPGLNKLLNFQRKFLIRLESIAEVTWKDQRWGLHFMENEEEFVVYEPYCANYTIAAELMLAEEQSLMAHNSLIHAKSELPAFLIKPVQRICKYPLLLDSLIKASSPADYPYYDELKSGSAAAKRITDKINEAQRRAENQQTVKNLGGRIEDWKGHHLSNFGDLLLDDVFTVKKSDVDREYHVFLFEKIILCCKEALPAPPNGRKVGKSNSLLKKQSVPSPLSLPGGPGQTKKKNTPLLLKGRIFLNNVTQAVPSLPRHSSSSVSSQYALSVYWRGDDDLEFFTLRCRSEEQLRQWENQINRLIKEAAIRKSSDRGLKKVVSQVSNSTSPAPSRQAHVIYNHEKSLSSTSHSPSLYPASTHTYFNLPSGRSTLNSYNSSEEQVQLVSPNGYPRSVYPGYPPNGGFDIELDDEFEDYPPSSSYPPSGRGTPLGSRNAQSMPPERDAIPGYDRPRAHTEDTNGPVMAQWRTQSPMAPPPSGGLPLAPNQRPITPRLMPHQTGSSFVSDSSFGPGVRPGSRPPLRSQFSSTKLTAVYNGEARSITPQFASHPQPPVSRSRSASQPSAYMPKPVAPPLPTATPWTARPNGSMMEGKRGSGSSQSTGESSDYSPNSSSPITPFGSSESSLGGMGTLRPSRSQMFENATRVNASHLQFSPPVKVKVHFHEDIFVIQVPRITHYNELVEKVGKKIHLCGRRRDDGPLRVKYRDEDGDMVSLGSTEDVQMAFEQLGPGGQVSLFVT
jgi:cell division control protein 24